MTALPSEPDNDTLNRLVAERVMGLGLRCQGPLCRVDVVMNNQDPRIHRYACKECLAEIAVSCHDPWGVPKSHQRNVLAYASDMNAAWEAVRKFTELPETFDVEREMRLSRLAFWWEKANLWAMKPEEAARAICIKMLDILGVVPEVF
jgi:hypothetical protein